MQGTRYYALSVFAADSGCRRGELLALKWSDIDLKSGVVSVSKSVSRTQSGLEIKVTKSRKTRYVRVSRATIQILIDHKERLKQEESLFGADYRSHNLGLSDARRRLLRAGSGHSSNQLLHERGWHPGESSLPSTSSRVPTTE